LAVGGLAPDFANEGDFVVGRVEDFDCGDVFLLGDDAVVLPAVLVFGVLAVGGLVPGADFDSGDVFLLGDAVVDFPALFKTFPAGPLVPTDGDFVVGFTDADFPVDFTDGDNGRVCLEAALSFPEVLPGPLRVFADFGADLRGVCRLDFEPAVFGTAWRPVEDFLSPVVAAGVSVLDFSAGVLVPAFSAGALVLAFSAGALVLAFSTGVLVSAFFVKKSFGRGQEAPFLRKILLN